MDIEKKLEEIQEKSKTLVTQLNAMGKQMEAGQQELLKLQGAYRELSIMSGKNLIETKDEPKGKSKKKD